MSETYDFNFNSIARLIRKNGGEYSEYEPARRAPTFGAYVLFPALMAALFTFVAVAGTLAGVLALLNMWLDNLDQQALWFVIVAWACGLSAAVACWVMFVVLLGEWRELQTREKRIKLPTPEREVQAERPIIRTATPNQSRPSQVKWKRGGFQRFLAPLFDVRGNWIASDRFIRADIEDSVFNASKRFHVVGGELVEMGWLTKDGEAYYWTDKGRQNALYHKLQGTPTLTVAVR